ncbi:hypothetical protein HDV04_004096 [Boothiomyces sp. JEL0838]|nr:hypothetical protein HDV04_004083 [Boothiomyces sp. JEL0838]KAJ3311384.1 hypothetical protein HDV04_004096 [Boothiomyces sp. JEL0838]
MFRIHIRAIHVPTYVIFGANTDVGKTIASAALTFAFKANNPSFIKPVQTGYPVDSDARFIKSIVGSASIKTLFKYTDPVSPHLAAIQESRIVDDDDFVGKVKEEVELSQDQAGVVFIETAGGVNSPTISGTLQGELYKRFGHDAILIGDSKLGGISTTISAYESLLLRGYKIPLILMFDSNYKNHEIIEKECKTKVILLEQSPSKHQDSEIDIKNMVSYYQRQNLDRIVEFLNDYHKNRIHDLEEMKNAKGVWWPFTQHDLVKRVMVVDSAVGDKFFVYENGKIKQLFDGCASWWTQGLGHGNTKLALAAGKAAGRYGHVISPETIHEPKHLLTQKLLELTNNHFSRVFYSDNGSTAMEVAVKMAFNTFIKRNQKELPTDSLKIIGIQGGYHGDTIGAMDLSDPNVFNSRVSWYTGKGMWFDAPVWELSQGKHIVTNIPNREPVQYDRLSDIFAQSRSDLKGYYRELIISRLKQATEDGMVFGSLVLEPVVLGAGGMLFIDPLFQRTLVEVVREPQTWNPKSPPIPVIFDEIFVGMYRLGNNLPSVSPLLGVQPDITSFAKCLTGGLLPLAVTLSTDEVFQSFRGNTKMDALLHGHSYTAHPVGCSVALESLELYKNLKGNEWNPSKILQLSKLSKIKRVNALGTVLVVELTSTESGYLSNAAGDFVKNLYENGVFVRTLGNVVYIMASQTTETKVMDEMLDLIASLLK